MQRHRFCTIAITASLGLANAMPVLAQTTAADSFESRLKGVWLIEAFETVRALNIAKVAMGADGNLVVEATYSGAPAKVSLSAVSSPFKMEVTTAAGTVMSLTESSPTTLTGTFAARSASGALSAIKFVPKKNPEIAAKCGASEGVWEGKWSQGNIGVMTLWLGEVASDCSAAVRYSRVKETVSINGGAFSFRCNPMTGGACSFKPQGKELWVAYSNPQGGTNNGVFKPVE